jgi:hypothetical protein
MYMINIMCIAVSDTNVQITHMAPNIAFASP